MNRGENIASQNEKGQGRGWSTACSSRVLRCPAPPLPSYRTVGECWKNWENIRALEGILEWSIQFWHYGLLYWFWLHCISKSRIAAGCYIGRQTLYESHFGSVSKSAYVQFHFMAWEVSQCLKGTYIPLLSNLGYSGSKLLFSFNSHVLFCQMTFPLSGHKYSLYCLHQTAY